MICNQCKYTLNELKNLRDKLDCIEDDLSIESNVIYDDIYESISEIIRSLQFEIDIKSINTSHCEPGTAKDAGDNP